MHLGRADSILATHSRGPHTCSTNEQNGLSSDYNAHFNPCTVHSFHLIDWVNFQLSWRNEGWWVKILGTDSPRNILYCINALQSLLKNTTNKCVLFSQKGILQKVHSCHKRYRSHKHKKNMFLTKDGICLYLCFPKPCIMLKGLNECGSLVYLYFFCAKAKYAISLTCYKPMTLR